jgi:anaerobic sulfite reductase subunit C
MVDYKELKKGGFMKQIHKDQFSVRLRIAGGQVEANQLKKIYEIAEKYGKGYVHLTSRQSIEIPFIKLEDIEEFKKELASVGLEPGACGPRMRTVTSCQGSKICPSGLIDTTSIARELDEKYNGKELPHKFKIGLTGCRNNCLKAEENDLGIKGGSKPEWDQSECSFCGLCQAVCPTKAIKVQRQNQELSFDEDSCIYCGKCVKSCPVNAWEGKNGYLLYFGGMFGNQIQIGKQLIPIIFNKEDLNTAVEIAIEFFESHANSGERFGKTLERVGEELLINQLQERLTWQK